MPFSQLREDGIFIIYDTYQNVWCAANEYFQHQAKQVDSLLNFIDTSIQKG